MRLTMCGIGVMVAAVVSLCITVLVYNTKVVNGIKIEMQAIEQINQDWSILPYTQITLRTGNCTANEEPVF